jgi:hypothetical protein
VAYEVGVRNVLSITRTSIQNHQSSPTGTLLGPRYRAFMNQDRFRFRQYAITGHVECWRIQMKILRMTYYYCVNEVMTTETFLKELYK